MRSGTSRSPKDICSQAGAIADCAGPELLEALGVANRVILRDGGTQPFRGPPRLTRSMSYYGFDRFVADSTESLVRTAYLIVWDLPEAEDLVQETLMKVAKRWPKVSRMDHPVAYARRILVNLALDGGPRRSRRRAELSDTQPGEPAAPAAVPSDAHDDLYAAIAKLAPRQRAVLVLRYFLDLPEAEVAATLQCSLGTVKSTASRGLARLEQSLRPTDNSRSIRS